jgi:hypothetical protein
MNKIKLIGVGAAARVGKDTFANCLIELFKRDGFIAKKYSLANELKKDMQQFLAEKCSMNVWTEDTNEKSKFRELLVSYGKIQRIRTNGTYWTSILQKQIVADAHSVSSDKPFIAIIPDIRYAEYEQDEHNWIKSQGGKLIHLERIEHNKLIDPANFEEKANSPMIKEYADFAVTWHTMSNIEIDNFDSYHYNVVKPIYSQIKPQ